MMTHAERAERRKKIYEAVKDGMPQSDAALKFGVTLATVLSSLKEAGHIKQRYQNPAMHERRSDMAEAVRSGKSIADVADAFQCSRPLVGAACKQFGVNREQLCIVKREQWEEMDWRKRDVDIARKLGVSRERVRQMRRAMGVPTKKVFLQIEFERFREWANQNRNDLRGLSLKDIFNICNIKTGEPLIAKWCKKLGIGKTIPIRDRIRPDNLESMTKKVQVREDMSECWQFHEGRHRYKMIGGMPTHWYIFEIFHGVRPDDKMILHRCDNRQCVNPEHIYAGTAQDNANDRAKNNPEWNHRITDEQAREMRRLFGLGRTLSSIADEFEFTYGSVWNTVRGNTHNFEKLIYGPQDGRTPIRENGIGCVDKIREFIAAGRSFTSGQFIYETGYRSTDFASSARSMLDRGEIYVEQRKMRDGGNIYGPPVKGNNSEAPCNETESGIG